jgi:hypothetical protein
VNTFADPIKTFWGIKYQSFSMKVSNLKKRERERWVGVRSEINPGKESSRKKKKEKKKKKKNLMSVGMGVSVVDNGEKHRGTSVDAK